MDKRYYVPFETAKMCQANGFPCTDRDMYYMPDGEMIYGYDLRYEEVAHVVPAPTYHEVLDWLENEKRCYIESCTIPSDNGNRKWYCWVKSPSMYENRAPYFCRKDALNEAIMYVLEMLKQ